MTLYVAVLYTHSTLRWVVLALGLTVSIRSGAGVWRGLSWGRTHERLHKALVHFADLQMIFGLGLYFWLSPFSRAFFHNPRVGFRNSMLRFFGVEHVFGMVIALTLVHLGQERSQRAANARDKQRLACLFTAGALLLMAASIPWPFMPYPRPLWRLHEAASPITSTAPQRKAAIRRYEHSKTTRLPSCARIQPCVTSDSGSTCGSTRSSPAAARANSCSKPAAAISRGGLVPTPLPISSMP